MKSGYYTYNNEKYRFELDDEHITVVNENGVNLKKFDLKYFVPENKAHECMRVSCTGVPIKPVI